IKGELTGEKAAGFYYTKARIPDRELDAPQIHPQAKVALTWAKTNASYWLGLIAAHQGSSESAIDWLNTRTLEATPDGPWTTGARYNLGRVYEAEGQFEKAVESYRANSGAPDRHGNLLRAFWLQPPESGEERVSSEEAERSASEADERPKGDSAESAEASPEEETSSPPADSPQKAPAEEPEET
ncbi:MAG: tetratricopeptide repeat protein, partial [Planctomycetes bacterium]|nr:tetratricopeptide repeat protein [Planctomycetota bacterium]